MTFEVGLAGFLAVGTSESWFLPPSTPRFHLVKWNLEDQFVLQFCYVKCYRLQVYYFEFL